MKEALSPYIDSFLAMISVEKGLSRNTVEAYSRDLSALCQFLLDQEVNSWTQLQPFHLRAYVPWLRRKGLGGNTNSRHIVTLRRLCLFLQTEGVLSDGTVPSLYLKTAGRKLPQPFSSQKFPIC